MFCLNLLKLYEKFIESGWIKVDADGCVLGYFLISICDAYCSPPCLSARTGSNELCMSQVIGPGPLQELNLCDNLWTHPNTFLHFLRSESLTPSAGRWLGKVREGTSERLQMSNAFEDFAPRCWDEAGPHPGCIDEVLPTIEAHNEGINAQVAWNTPDHELLPGYFDSRTAGPSPLL